MRVIVLFLLQILALTAFLKLVTLIVVVLLIRNVVFPQNLVNIEFVLLLYLDDVEFLNKITVIPVVPVRNIYWARYFQ
jgi:hypothetical protein